MNTSDWKNQILQTVTLPNHVPKENILIVDDNPGNLRLVLTVLSERGYKIRPARDAEMALRFARSTPPDLILLDVMMPKLNGYQICQQLKADDRTKEIPVIFISVLNEVFDKVQAFTVGAADYITKPFQIEELVARVENQLMLGRLSRQLLAQNAQLQAEIQQRKQIESELRESQHWLSAVVKTNPNILYVCDLIEKRALYLNREIYSDLGYTASEIQQMPAAIFSELIHAEDLPVFAEHRQRIETAKDGEIFEFEYRIQDKHGQYKWFLSRETVFTRKDDGKPRKILGTATEISDRKQVEIELKTALNALERQIKQRFLLETITLEIRYSLNQEQVFQTASAQISRIFNTDVCSIYIYKEEQIPSLVCVAKYQDPGLKSNLVIEFFVENNPHTEFVMSQDRAVVTDDIFTDPLLESSIKLCRKTGLRSTVAVRTSYHGKANGIMYLQQYDRPRKWMQEEIRLLEAVAAQMGIAIAQANLLAQEKQQRIKLQQSEERFYLAFEGSATGLWDWNLKTGEVYFNQRWKAMLGYQVEEIENSFASWEKLVHPEDLPAAMAAVKSHFEGETPLYEAEFRMLAKSGEWKWILAQAKVMERDELGNPLRMTGTHTDISDRKKAAVALQVSEQREREKAQQLEQTLQELKRAQAQLIQAEKMSSIGQMVAGVAHEINNPISFIYGNITPASQYASDLLKLLDLYQHNYPEPTQEIADLSESIDTDFIAEDFPKILASMKQGANRIKQIVLSLRNFSRLDEKERKVVDVHEGIESALVMLQHRLKEPRKYGEIQVIKEYGNLPRVECYPAQLNQVFMNVLSNAIDALEEPAAASNDKPIEIRIATEITEKNLICIRITDTGTGIRPEILSKIFDPFFTTKEVGKGTGLGLSISYQIVKDKHGGDLKCYSEVGKGTEFAIELPILQKLRGKTST
ncbi:MAG: PAS domain-containing protein [Microcoleus sp.]